MKVLMRLLKRLYNIFRTGIDSSTHPVPPVPPAHVTHQVYIELLQSLQGVGEDSSIAEPLLIELECNNQFLGRYDVLTYLLERHPFPDNVNYLLACEERDRNVDIVKSVPPNVHMDLTSFCNVECRFCKYTRGYHSPQMITLDQVKAIEWFKHVKWLNFSAGTGESIMNPQFVDIFEYVRTTYPRLHIEFLTNGLALKESLTDLIVGRLDQMHISMNASNEEDYHKVIKGGSWRTFSKNLQYLQSALKNVDRPRITASFVMMRWNIERAVEYLEFAVDIGASFIMFHHYYTPYIRDIHSSDPRTIEEKFPKSESLYYHRELSDRVFAQVEERARQLGAEVKLPVPFSENQFHMAYAMRLTGEPLVACPAPWQSMFLLWGFKSMREEVTICCGLASDIGLFFDRDKIASRSGLMDVWNSPIMQAYRRTCNSKRKNPICALCRKVDRFDPDAHYPDQRLFFTFNGLEVPPHFESVPPGEELSKSERHSFSTKNTTHAK
jgi:MoaA/NifB/PqqE/SkfB family radical SAM enzyme